MLSRLHLRVIHRIIPDRSRASASEQEWNKKKTLHYTKTKSPSDVEELRVSTHK